LGNAMAAETFLLPFRPALDANGIVVAGAKLYFYATGTTTPQAVYSDSGLTTPLTNPVEANAAGVWPTIYLNDALTYRVVLKTSGGSTLDDVDPYIPGMPDALPSILQGSVDDAEAAATASATSATAADTSADAAAASATLAGHYANDDTNVDVPGGSAGERGAKYWADEAAAAAGTFGTLTEASTERLPIFKNTSADKFPMWSDNGLLSGAGLSYYLRTKLAAQMVSDGTIVPKLAAPSRGSKAISTDGRTLSAWRRKRAKIQAGLSSILRIGFAGHSWAAFGAGAAAVRDRILSDLGLSTPSAGAGWVPVLQQTNCNALGQTITYGGSGFTQLGNPSGVINPAAVTRGCGPDGMAVYATGTSATLSWNGLLGRKITLYYWDGDGTFRYRVDSGSWTTVTCGSTSAHAKLSISGLANTTHLLEIDLTGNAGTVEFHGLLTEDTSITSGVLFLKFGTSGMKGREASTIPSASKTWWNTELATDLHIVTFGLNDFNQQQDVVFYQQGLIDLFAMAANGKVLILEPQCGASPSIVQGPAVIPQSSYRDGGLATALAQGWEWLNLYDDWDTYSAENTGGAWSDTLHPWPQSSATTDSTGSARRFANALCNNLLFK